MPPDEVFSGIPALPEALQPFPGRMCMLCGSASARPCSQASSFLHHIVNTLRVTSGAFNKAMPAHRGRDQASAPVGTYSREAATDRDGACRLTGSSGGAAQDAWMPLKL